MTAKFASGAPPGSTWKRDSGSQSVFVVVSEGCTKMGTPWVEVLILAGVESRIGTKTKLPVNFVLRAYERVS